MPETESSHPIPLKEGEKITPVMLYLMNMLAWGEVVTKEAIRVSTWLRTPMVPQYITLHNASVVFASVSGTSRPQKFKVIHFPVAQTIAFHLMPPHHDPLDYDANEPHRKMEPVTVLVGAFRFDGLIRMSTITDLERYLDVTKETFTPMYDLAISQPGAAGIGVIKVSYVLLRRDMVAFSTRE